MSQQLVKKGANGGYSNVMPKSWIEAIKDKNTGKTLVEILQSFNMYFLSYDGNSTSTRCLVPTMLRKKGLWITYVKYDGNVYTEWYAADEIDDTSWGDSSNWRIGNNTLVGDITISANGNWVINGTETEFKVVGEKGNTPLVRFGSNNKFQVSYNNGEKWLDISDSITNNLRIKKYIGINESLPTSGVEEGAIYMKGPYYAEDDTLNDNPIYRMWVYAWKGNTLAWQDNGEFTSIVAGVVQETGDSETEVMSQKAVTEKLSELESKGVIRLAYKAISNIVTNLEVGEYGWNDSTNLLIKKTSSSGQYEIYNPNINSGVYIYNSAYYRFNGSGLEVFAVEGNILNSIILESGSVDSVGNLKDNNKRVRSAYSIEGNFNIYVPNPSMVVYAIVYYKNNGTFDSYVQVNDRFSINMGKDGCVAKVVFAHKDLSTEITPTDVTLSNLDILYNDIKTLQHKIVMTNIQDIAWEQGGLNIAGGAETISTTRIRNANFIKGTIQLTLPKNLMFLSVCYYDAITFSYDSYDTSMAGTNVANIGKDGCVAKVAVAKISGGDISITDMKNSDALDVAYKQAIHSAPLAEFSYDHELKDVSRDIEDFTIRWAEATVMEQVYEHFDALCEAHPSYISKVDAAELAGLSYPVYANLNGVANETYLATPSYKTYLYKLIDNNANAGSVEGGVNAKRKLFIVGGTHGIEVAGCVNSYLFAKMLCEGKDVNYFKLRESYDIYILPCLNGYGIYHMTRVNANGVDINRNYPIKGWSSNGSVGDVDYTGDTAGSEFETQLIMALTSHINPDIAIDHHNYWPNLKWQFYTNVKKKEYVPLLYQSLVDCSYAFIKGLPSYFGNTPKLFLEGSGSSISGTRIDNSGTTLAWWDEYGVKISSTLEICCGIGYINGVHVKGEEGYDYYGADTFSIAEYTLRNQVLRFCDYCMKRL